MPDETYIEFPESDRRFFRLLTFLRSFGLSGRLQRRKIFVFVIGHFGLERSRTIRNLSRRSGTLVRSKLIKFVQTVFFEIRRTFEVARIRQEDRTWDRFQRRKMIGILSLRRSVEGCRIQIYDFFDHVYHSRVFAERNSFVRTFSAARIFQNRNWKKFGTFFGLTFLLFNCQWLALNFFR